LIDGGLVTGFFIGASFSGAIAFYIPLFLSGVPHTAFASLRCVGFVTGEQLAPEDKFAFGMPPEMVGPVPTAGENSLGRRRPTFSPGRVKSE
jgi:hypothetical protein